MAVELWRNCGGYTGIIALSRCDRAGSKGQAIHHKEGRENGGRKCGSVSNKREFEICKLKIEDW